MLRRIVSFPSFFPFSFLFLFFTILSPPAIVAQTTNGYEIIENHQQALEEDRNLESWKGDNALIDTLNTQVGLIGPIPQDVIEDLKNGELDNFRQKIKTGAYRPGGMFGMTNQMIASLYQSPASGIEYIAQLKNNLLGKPAYAQGAGFRGLAPILSIWRAFRNIIYVAASLVFVVIGIMIMLRVKVSPQASVTIQNAIPQIISALVLVTFSYAIAGLLIDLSQFIQSIALAVLFQSQGTPLNQNLFPDVLTNTNFQGLSTRGMGLISDLTFRAIPIHFLSLFPMLLFTIFLLIPGAQVMAPIMLLGPALLVLISVILLLFWMFKFYFGALKCYVSVIFKVVTSPFEIALGSFPQSKVNFHTWVWDLIANLSVFPISVLFLVLVNVIIDKVTVSPWGVAGDGIWAPSIITSGLQGVLIGTLTAGNFVAVGIGFTAAMLVSKLPEMIPQFIFMIKPSPWSQAASDNFSGIMNTPRNFAQSVHTYAGFFDDVRRIKPKSPQAPQAMPVYLVNAPPPASQQGYNQPRNASRRSGQRGGSPPPAIPRAPTSSSGGP